MYLGAREISICLPMLPQLLLLSCLHLDEHNNRSQVGQHTFAASQNHCCCHSYISNLSKMQIRYFRGEKSPQTLQEYSNEPDSSVTLVCLTVFLGKERFCSKFERGTQFCLKYKQLWKSVASLC